MSKDQIKKKNYTVHNDDKNVLAFRFVLVFFLLLLFHEQLQTISLPALIKLCKMT
jgi:hypothetical protein